MAKLLFQITRGPDDPTLATLPLLVAKAAAEAGHEVSVFLGGEGVQLIRDAALEATTGVGTGNAREHVDGLTAAGARFYISRMSANARGVTEADLAGKPAEMILPARLVELILEADRALVY